MFVAGSTLLALVLGWVWYQLDEAKIAERKRREAEARAHLERRDRDRLGKL